jgi:hypothetical protein
MSSALTKLPRLPVIHRFARTLCGGTPNSPTFERVNRQGDHMPTDDHRLRSLPEPADLHTQLARDHPLDWGDTIPSTAALIAEFGVDATRQSLTLLRDAARHHDHVTDQLVSSIHPGDRAHQLDCRVKSPASLARKFWTYGKRNRPVPADDVLRFTILTTSPDTLVESTRGTVDRLAARGWSVESAHQSYVDGSRYKGLHAIMRSADGQQVEVQFHTPESVAVKHRTTEFYEIERDPRHPKSVRDEARRVCVRLSAEMTKPAGIDDLAELQGVPVEARSYGARIRRSATRHEPGPPRDEVASKLIRQPTQQIENDRKMT